VDQFPGLIKRFQRRRTGYERNHDHMRVQWLLIWLHLAEAQKLAIIEGPAESIRRRRLVNYAWKTGGSRTWHSHFDHCATILVLNTHRRNSLMVERARTSHRSSSHEADSEGFVTTCAIVALEHKFKLNLRLFTRIFISSSASGTLLRPSCINLASADDRFERQNFGSHSNTCRRLSWPYFMVIYIHPEFIIPLSC
jgi:hypothetical protein